MPSNLPSTSNTPPAGLTPLAVSVTASGSQEDLSRVSQTATPTGGIGVYSYAWTLTDPRGADRTALLSSSTAASPTWDPDAIPGAWVAQVTVTSGAQTAKAARVQTVGVAGWVEVADFDFTAEADQSPSGGTLTVSNRAQHGSPAEVLTLINEANDNASGPKIASGRLLISPKASTAIASATGTQAAPGFGLALSTILAGYAQALDRGSVVAVVAAFDVVSWVNTNDELMVTLGATAGLGGGAGGSGLGAGLLKQAGGVRGRVITQADSQRNANTLTGIDATTARVLAAIFPGGGSVWEGWSATVTDAATLSTALALAEEGASDIHGALPYATAATAAVEYMPPSEWTVRALCGTSHAAPGAVWALSRLRVLVRP